MKYTLIVLTILFGVMNAAVHAQSPSSNPDAALSYPRLEVKVEIEVENKHVYDADDPGDETNDLSTTTEPAFALHLLPGLSVEAGLALISKDSTLRSNLTGGMPLDLLVYRKDELRVTLHRRIEENDASFHMIRETWSNALREAYVAIPLPDRALS